MTAKWSKDTKSKVTLTGKETQPVSVLARIKMYRMVMEGVKCRL